MANDMKETKPGISFSSYMGSFGNTNSEINSGFSFDLPLSVVDNFGQTALSFLRGNSAQNQALFQGTVNTAQNNVTATANRSFQYQENALSSIQGMSDSFGNTLNNAVNKRSRGFCFITTAICELDGKPDDCEELTVLRKFRDEVMLPNPKLAGLVAEYYAVAPAIVEGIKKRDDSEKCWRILYEAYLKDAVLACKHGEYDDALTIYLDMVSSANVMAGEVITHG